MNRLVRLVGRRPIVFAGRRPFAAPHLPNFRRYASQNPIPDPQERLESLYDQYIVSCAASIPAQPPISFEQFKETVEDLETLGMPEPIEQEADAPILEKYDDILDALAEMEQNDPDFQQTLDTMTDSVLDELHPNRGDSLFVQRLNSLDVENSPEDEVAQRVAQLVLSTTDTFSLEQVEDRLATYNGPLSTLNVAVEWYLNNPDAIDLPEKKDSDVSASSALQQNPLDALEATPVPTHDNNSYYRQDTPIDELVRHMRNRDVLYAVQHRFNYKDRAELIRLIDSIVTPVLNEDMAIFDAIAAIFAKYEDVELEFHTEPRLPHIRRLEVFKRLLPRPDDETPADKKKDTAEIREIVDEVKKQEEIEEAERRAKEQPWPNLMTRDPLLDSRDVLELPPTKENPFHNKVVVRNHHSIFTEALHADGFDFSTYKPTQTDDIEEQNTDDFVNLTVPKVKIDQLLQFPVYSYMAKQQTGKGKIARHVNVIIMGDGKGMVGLGIGKHEKPEVARTKALRDGLRNLDWVERFEDRTIWKEVRTKFGATTVILRPRPVGFGLRCNPYIHRLLTAAGITDISAKVWGSRNRMGVMKATLRLLQAGHAPLGMGDGVGGPGRKSYKGTGLRNKSEIERERGRRLVDLRL
ncbi:hypothetical protein K438DRAFT_1973239 [Mycena galopus ATCC 62051]|nr:hypothetical protein K438DRAFT_1973239 [Mycena galopus ATCC 62051]